MLRRSRFSVRPNVGAAGRTAAATAASQETPAVSKDAGDPPKIVTESSAPASEFDHKAAEAQSEKPAPQGDANEPSTEASSSSSAVQRRKRFSAKPKVAAGRPSALARAQKSPVKAVSQSHVEAKDSITSDKPKPSSQADATELSKGPLSPRPRNRRLSEESKQSKPQPKPSPADSDCSEPAGVAAAQDLPDKCAESAAGLQVKDVAFKVPDKVLPSLPDKEAVAISERAKALVSSRVKLSASPAAYTLSRLLNDPSDLQRLAKAQRLRDLMKKEVVKEKRKRRANLRAKEFTLDPAKMTMRDLIHYLPESNPMTTSLEEPVAEEQIAASPSPERENSTPERPQEAEPPPEAASASVEDEDEAAATEEEQEEALMVPQVKVAEDGSLIIDEESLTVEVQRAKGPNPANEREPIFERGSTTTYSSFRKGTYSKPWSNEETDMFFLAISMVGTDFSMICQLFPHRARSEIKNKFKKEERENTWRIDKAFKDRQKLDIEYFSKLLEKILEVQKNRKKLKSLAEKNSPRKNKRNPKGKKSAKRLSDVEEEDEDDMPDLEGEEEEEEEEEEEGEKENEDNCNDGGTPGPKAKRKWKRAHGSSATIKEPNNKKMKADKSDEREEALTHEDAETALPDHPADSESCGPTENLNARKDAEIKPAKLSRGRAPRPVPQLGGRRGRKPPASPKKPRDASTETGDRGVADETAEEQANEDVSPARQDSKRKSGSDGASSEDEGAAVLPLKPTRYGRMPKPTKPLTYPARDDSPSAPEDTPSSPSGCPPKAAKPKCTLKKRKSQSKSPAAHKSKKPKLFTIKAQRVEYSDEEEEAGGQWDEEQHPECSSAGEGGAFVPPGLCSPPLLMAEVEEEEVQEEVEEFDVLVNMPDVLDITQDALCPDATCELAHNETGQAEPSEHQLDLLVDVIDCLSSDYPIAEDESYNEAAHTLLAIGNVTQFPENEAGVQGQSTESTPSSGRSDPLDQDPHGKTKDDDMPVKAAPAPPLPSPELSEKMPPPTRTGRSSKVKPTPNIGHASRSKTADRPAVSGSEEQATGKNTQDLLQSEDSPPLQQSSEDPAPVAALGKASPGRGAEPGTSRGGSSRQSRRGVKPQPNLTKATSRARSRPEATAEPVDSGSSPSVDPDPAEPVHVQPVETSAAAPGGFREHQITVKTSPRPSQTSETPAETAVQHPQAAEGSPGADPDPDSISGEPHIIQSEHPPQTPAKSRFQKIKAKPNLTQVVRSARSRPGVSKTPEEKVSSPGLGAQSHHGPAAESTEEQLSATLATELKSSPGFESTEASPTPVEKEGEGPGSDPDSTPAGESRVSPTETLSKPPGRSRFQKIKPKPNVALASRSSLPKPKVSSCDVTHPVEPETQPTTTSPSENAAFASESKPSSDAAAPPVSQEDLKEMDVGALGQQQSSSDPEQAAAADSVPAGEPGSQEKDQGSSSVCQARRREKVKPKPRLAARSAATKTAGSKVPLTEEMIAEEAEQTETQPPSGQSHAEPTATAAPQYVEQEHEGSSAGEQRTDVESDQGSTSEGSSRNLQLRRRFSRVKPNLGSCARKKLSGQQAEVSELPPARDHSQQVATLCGSSQKTEAVGSEAQPESETCSVQKLSDLMIKSDVTQLEGSCQQSHAENIESGDAVQQRSENSSESENKSEPLKCSGKPLQASRGRLVRPKPNVALSRRGQRQKESQPKDAVPLSEVVVVPAEGGQASEGHTDTLRPAGGASEQPTHTQYSDVGDVSLQGDASVSSCLTPIDPSTLLQDGQTSGVAGGNQSHSGLKLFSDLLPEQVPSDPNEPFFILSLTEVPLMEVAVGGASEPPPSPPGPPGSSPLQHDDSVAVGFTTVSEAPRDSAASAEAASENPADSQAKGNEQHLSESKRQRHSQGADKVPTQPRTSTEEPSTCTSREESSCCTGVAQESPTGQEEPEGGRSKVKATAGVSRRNQKDATPPSVEAPPLEAPTGNSTGLGSSAEDTEAASSAWGTSSVGPALEATWAEDELLDWQPSGIQESSSSSRLEDIDEPTAVSQYFLGDIFTEVESE